MCQTEGTHQIVALSPPEYCRLFASKRVTKRGTRAPPLATPLALEEPFEKFFTELKTRAAACNFQKKDPKLRDKIVFTVTGKLQELAKQ